MSASPSPLRIRALLVDDEEMALHRLGKALQLHPQIEVIGEAMDGQSTVTMINTLHPDLVFLDIQMPGLNGFEVLSQLTHRPLIVFVTAYESYAIKAFEENSLDYLLKPVDPERLAVTIKRILEHTVRPDDILNKITQLMSQSPAVKPITTIPVSTGAKTVLIHVNDVCFFEAKDKYVSLYTATEEKVIEPTLNYLAERLPPEFIRVHRSFIVNKLKIKEIHKYFKGTFLIVMNDAKSSKIKSAYSYHDIIKTQLLLP